MKWVHRGGRVARRMVEPLTFLGGADSDGHLISSGGYGNMDHTVAYTPESWRIYMRARKMVYSPFGESHEPTSTRGGRDESRFQISNFKPNVRVSVFLHRISRRPQRNQLLVPRVESF